MFVKRWQKSQGRINIRIIAAAGWLTLVLYGLLTDQVSVMQSLWLLLYTATPLLLLFIRPKDKQSLLWHDMVILAVLWVSLEFGGIGMVNLPPVHAFVSLSMLFGLLLLLYIYQVRLNFPLGYEYRLEQREWTVALFHFMILFVLLTVVGGQIGFVSMAKRLPGFHQVIVKLISIGFFIAIPQEILFRGVLYTLIEKKLQNRRYNVLWALVISSVIYGLAHINDVYAPVAQVSLGGAEFPVPWAMMLLATLSGVFYGWVYIRTRKITASALTHFLINASWFLFFS
ncbi:MAG: CPBP family intramembrane glutamic endopeptidase [candidate division KSB1 bacterium]|nr:CPBP family intramembrane glutamic endopeptidase [candidate division KSB1 bacterium]